MQCAVEDPRRECFGQGRRASDCFEFTGWVRRPGVYGDEGDAASTGGLERDPSAPVQVMFVPASSFATDFDKPMSPAFEAA